MSARVLGLLPARGGSKSIPGKNLRNLLGKPLIAWSAQALQESSLPARKICSTDSKEIAEVAVRCGLEVPWMRPAHLGEDNTLVVDVIAHTLEMLEREHNEQYTHVALVQATSPAVTAKDIDDAIRMAINGGADTVITGFFAGQRHPVTMYTIDENGEVHWLLTANQRMMRRQDMPPVFIRTGVVYVMRSDLVRNERTLYGKRILALTVPEERSVTIDEELDFKLAEFFMKEFNDG